MSSQNSLRPIEILLVEDSPTDRLITTTALENSKLLNSLHVVENGVEAMSYLRREGKYADSRRPDIILLDLNLPKKDGREVLAEIKSDPHLKFIPVVVLTTSASKEDLLCAYSNHANSFIAKPVDFQRFSEALLALGGYWFEVVTLPPDLEVEAQSRALLPRQLPTTASHGDSGIHVLLIEDSPTDAVLFRLALEGSRGNFKLTHASRIEEARTLLASQTFHLVVTDLGLPDSQGVDTYRKVRGYAVGVPIIVLTSLDNDTTGVDALHEGADDYLVKGELSPHALARAARYAIDKQNFRERRRQSERLEAIGRLAAGVAHDFNNILTIVRVNAELLSVAQGSQEVSDSAQEIQGAADRAIALARQLLTFSRQQAMQTGPIDLNEVIGTFCKMLRRVVGDSVRLDLHLGAELPMVLADTGMIEQILLNLAVNARDAMPSGGKPKNSDFGDRDSAWGAADTRLVLPRSFPAVDRGRHRCGNRAGVASPHLRALLHDEEIRRGNRTGPFYRSWHCSAAPGLD